MSGIAGIGNTPVVRLDRLPGSEDAEVWVKLEAANQPRKLGSQLAGRSEEEPGGAVPLGTFDHQAPAIGLSPFRSTAA